MGLERCLIKKQAGQEDFHDKQLSHASIYIANFRSEWELFKSWRNHRELGALSLDNLTMAIGC